MDRKDRLWRAMCGGSALAVAIGGSTVGGFRAEALSQWRATWSEYHYGLAPSFELPSPVMVIALALTGGAVGAAYVVASRLLPFPRVATGALCGISLWGATELAYHGSPDRQQHWSAPPLSRLTRLGAFGVAVAVVSDAPRLGLHS